MALDASAIGAISKIAVGFADKDIPSVVADIVENGERSGHLPIVVEESDPETLEWWLRWLEKK